MIDGKGSYQKSVQQFLTTLETIRRQPINSQRELARQTKTPYTTTNRLLHEMEAEGLLTRDSGSTLLSGEQLLRIGLNAWGLGQWFSVCEPVLQQLQHDTHCTAFLGLLEQGCIRIGPFVSGNHSDFFLPEPEAIYHYQVIEEWQGAMYVSLTIPSQPIPRIIEDYQLCFRVLEHKDLFPITGVFYKTSRTVSDLASHIEVTCQRFQPQTHRNS